MNINIIDAPGNGIFTYSIEISIFALGGIPESALFRARNRSIQAIVIPT